MDNAAVVTSSPNTNMTYAGFWRRFLAVFIDGIMVGTVTGIIGFALSLVPTIILSTISDSSDASVIILQLLHIGVSIIQYGLALAYYIILIGKNGQTLGKKIMNIKVVNISSHQAPGYGSAALRETIGKFLSGLILCIGYLTMIWDKNKQTWHDKIANTVVIKV